MSLFCLVFITDYTQSNRLWQLSFNFNKDLICTISHIIVISSFRRYRHSIRSAQIVRHIFHLQPQMYDRSCRCPVQFLSQMAHGPIGHDNSILFLAQIILVLLVMLLSCLVFITNHTQLDRFRQFNFGSLQTRPIDWSRHCPVWFLTQTPLNLIRHGSSILFSMRMTSL